MLSVSSSRSNNKNNDDTTTTATAAANKNTDTQMRQLQQQIEAHAIQQQTPSTPPSLYTHSEPLLESPSVHVASRASHTPHSCLYTPDLAMHPRAACTPHWMAPMSAVCCLQQHCACRAIRWSTRLRIVPLGNLFALIAIDPLIEGSIVRWSVSAAATVSLLSPLARTVACL